MSKIEEPLTSQLGPHVEAMVETLRPLSTILKRRALTYFREQVLEQFAVESTNAKVVELRLTGMYTFQEIGESLGISRSRAHQIWKKAVRQGTACDPMRTPAGLPAISVTRKRSQS